MEVKIGDLADAIMQKLREYGDEVIGEVKKAEDVTAKECVENLKTDSPVGATGKYAKGWGVKTAYEDPTEKRVVVHNKVYQLTHLLENGHANRDGGRTKAYPHIKKNEEIANAAFEKRVEEAIQNAGH